MTFEYKCVGAPERPKRLRGAWSRSDRVALAMQEIIDAEAVDGWEYLRTDTVPVEEKAGFFSRTQEVHRAVLVFRRESLAGRPARPARPTLSAADAGGVAAMPAAMPTTEVSLPREAADAPPDARPALSAERAAPPPPRAGRTPSGLG